ncbi:iron-containing alcohol dehydrogenase [Desulfovibrio aminophilus]|nr:alcohol dehydrogenase-like regulatory protein ErcA [Desulfovibrio aminophilus]MCM0755466.1 iron-containing alcohol dehydrogenase [Desulfovibrio aminophilus]
MAHVFDLRKFVAPESVFGEGAAALAGQYARNLGAGKVLLVSDPGVRDAGWTGLVRESLDEEGLDVSLYLNVSPNPRDHQVMQGAEQYDRDGCDCIVAVGGGSPMDLAKGVGIVHSNRRHILEFEGADRVDRPAPPLICVPTTAGSSADVSQFAIITDTARKVKIAIVSKTLVADAALIDPLTTVTMGPELTAETGMDALSHAMEAFASNANGPLTDLLALDAMRLVRANLPRAIAAPEDLEARGNMMLGSMEAGLAFSNAILGAVHAMAHSLGGYMDLPHGLCNAILLPHVVDRNFQSAPERYMKAAEALGVSARTPAAARAELMRTLQDLNREVGMDKSLAELGVTRESLRALAEKAVQDPCLTTNPAELGVEDIEAIYERAL